MIYMFSFSKDGSTCGGSCEDVHHSSCVDLLLTKPDMCNDITMADKYCKRTCGKCGMSVNASPLKR